ncbi:hypothetical protein J6590_013288 [Homalodisca vitripennis]|nr:hypothetical protein J6590_013288 [Homalodisca vitripennis]
MATAPHGAKTIRALWTCVVMNNDFITKRYRAQLLAITLSLGGVELQYLAFSTDYFFWYSTIVMPTLGYVSVAFGLPCHLVMKNAKSSNCELRPARLQSSIRFGTEFHCKQIEIESIAARCARRSACGLNHLGSRSQRDEIRKQTKGNNKLFNYLLRSERCHTSREPGATREFNLRKLQIMVSELPTAYEAAAGA